jgi:hypothetical protein
VSEDGLWPVTASEAVAETLADPALPVGLFSKIVALTVAIAENPWLANSSSAPHGDGWRTVPIPDGGGLVEYFINEADRSVILTRIAPF